MKNKINHGICLLLVVTLILTPVMPAAAEDETALVQQGDIIYFGQPDSSIGFDGAWRVLDANQTNTGEPGLFLLSDNLIGRDLKHGLFFRNEKEPQTNAYQGSDAKAWCAAFYEKYFTAEEQALIVKTYKSDPAFAIRAAIGDGEHAPMVNFDPAENILDGDSVFLLSAEEASNAAYGLDADEARIAGLNGTAANWWLRSPHDPSFPIDVGLVFYNGWLMDFFENWDNAFYTAPICMRPALNLDPASIGSLERVGEGEWRVVTGEAASPYTYHARITPRQPIMASAIIWIAAAVVILVIGGIATGIVLLVRHGKRRKAKSKTR